MSDVISLGEHKAKQANIFRFENALRDIEAYEDVVSKSIAQFNSYGIQEKYDLYLTLAEFNVEILHQLIEKMKDEQ